MHRLLSKQIERYLSDEDISRESIQKFISAVEEAYRQADEDYQTLESAMDLASDELIERYNHIREEIGAKLKAQEANRAKNDFLSRMSHELRTPLNAIIGFGQLLTMRSKTLTEGERQQVDEILKAGNHLLALINDILDLSRIKSGNLPLNMSEFNVQESLKECLALMQTQAERKHVKVSIDDGPADLCVKADPIRFKQVVLNILTNAVKYNRDHGRVHVRFQPCDSDRIQIDIEDTGIGIPEDKVRHLYEPFHRLGAEGGKEEGIGIGLCISQLLVEQMEGSIQFQSTLGKGTTFTLRFGRGAAKPAREAAPEPSAPQPVKDDPERGKTVLYVEDNENNLKLVQEVLAAAGGDITLLSASRAREGIQKALEHRPDLILMDIQLPEMSGFEALAHLKQMEETRNIPVVAVSANAMQSDIQRGLQCGFADYVTKPIQMKPFLEMIDTYLNSTPEMHPVRNFSSLAIRY